MIKRMYKLDKIEDVFNNINNNNLFNLIPYGKYKGKLEVKNKLELKTRKDGKLILVTSITPTCAADMKTTCAISLVDGLNKVCKTAIGCLQEPSIGDIFSVRDNTTGTGNAQIMPAKEINLHFTGDMHAITTANNLVSACLDNSIYQGNPLNIDPEKIVWKRCLDMNDRSLQDIMITQGTSKNVKRKESFINTTATEIMEILCISTDSVDFRKRVANCVVAKTYDNKNITINDLQVTNAICAVMEDALKPNLVQTLYNNPILIHGKSSANVSLGCNSLIATKMALKLSDYVVTEAGFGADLGAEKFLDIKCRMGNLKPNAIVLVATIQDLKLHSGVNPVNVTKENPAAVRQGMLNLFAHREFLEKAGIPLIIALNKSNSDFDSEIQMFKSMLSYVDVYSIVDTNISSAIGSVDLAKKVIKACTSLSTDVKFYYNADDTPIQKIKKLAENVYYSDKVEYSPLALEKLQKLSVRENKFCVCVVKTEKSLSDDRDLKNWPTGSTLHVKDIEIKHGVGLLIVYTDNVSTMPGMPLTPNAIKII